jgi:hypothetical protein
MLRPTTTARAVRVARSMLTEIREGFQEVRSRTWLWVMIGYFGVFQFAVFPAYQVLGPNVAKHSLGGAKAWAVILTAGAVGSIIAGFASLRVRTARPVFLSTAVCLTCGLPALLLGLRTPVVLIAAGAFLFSAGLTLGDTLWQTTLQQQIPEQSLSRVAAIDWTGSLVLNPIGFALVGPIAAGIGINHTLIASAALTTTVTLATLSVPSVRHLRSTITPVASLPRD